MAHSEIVSEGEGDRLDNGTVSVVIESHREAPSLDCAAPVRTPEARKSRKATVRLPSTSAEQVGKSLANSFGASGATIAHALGVNTSYGRHDDESHRRTMGRLSERNGAVISHGHAASSESATSVKLHAVDFDEVDWNRRG